MLTHLRRDAKKRTRRRTRFGRNCAGIGANHDRARFRLPPRIDDRAPFPADHLSIPHPRFQD